MAVTKSIPGFLSAGAIRGLSTGMFSIVPLTIIINNWLKKVMVWLLVLSLDSVV